MSFLIHGIGIRPIPAKALLKHKEGFSADAVNWFVISLLPVVPLKPIHAFCWRGGIYQSIPIRWSWSLIWRSFLRAFLIWPAMVFGILLVVWILRWIVKGQLFLDDNLELALWFGLIAFVGYMLFAWTDRRNRHIRLLLGSHSAGWSDPATWQESLLSCHQDPTIEYGASSCEDLVQGLLAKGEFSRAMWAARLAVGLGSDTQGEELTIAILRHEGVKIALNDLCRGTRTWEQAMFAPRTKVISNEHLDR